MITSSQASLVAELKTILADGPKNTHQIALLRGDCQAYESHLRDRLFRLATKGFVTFEEKPSCIPGWVARRTWKLA